MTLADYVYADLGHRIARKEQPPCRLTYAALCHHYGVSLTPVRAAVKRLQEEGLLVAQSNGRLVAPADPPEFAPDFEIASETFGASQAENRVRQALIRDSLLGRSEFIREEAAAERFSIGRTALRPILSRLAGAGILEHVPRCGWRVCPFSKDDLVSFLEVRELLEVKALRLAFERLDGGVLQRLCELNRNGEIGDGELAENDLHGYWVSLSNNRFIHDFFGVQSLHVRTMLAHVAPATQSVEEMSKDHCRILEALLASDLPTAERELADHIRAQKPTMMQLLDRLRSGADDES